MKKIQSKILHYCQSTMLALTTSMVIGCVSLPDNTHTKHSTALPININQPTGELQKLIIPDTSDPNNIDKTGIYMLYDGQDAFIARLALLTKAKHSIDAQYYIWHDDISGRILLQNLLNAAERGVRVRFLLDDNSTKGMDNILTKLNQHPNIEVRLFNPYSQRQHRTLGYFTDTRRINRRMHNKSLTVDGVISIIGGRNIGDEYFEAKNGVLFADLDVSLVGDVVSKIEKDFDRYWASISSYPINLITQSSSFNLNSQSIINSLNINNLSIENKEKTKDYLFSLFTRNQFQQYLKNNKQGLVWAVTDYYSDPPSKVLLRNNQQAFSQSVIAKLMPTITNTKEQLIIISPYFVPTKKGTKILTDMAKKGKKVIIVTNSLSATDVTIVHTGYMRYRKQLLKAGIELYEFKAEALENKQDKPKEDLNGIMPDSNASLHAKAFTSDDNYLFIGSPNLDPRSANLNTELGVLIHSKELVKKFQKVLFSNGYNHSYKVSLNDSGKLQWHILGDEGKDSESRYVIYHSEPETDITDRALVEILSLLPIEGWL